MLSHIGLNMHLTMYEQRNIHTVFKMHKINFLVNYLTKEALSSLKDIQATALTGDMCPGITR